MTRAFVRVTLEDGSGCYVTSVPVASFHPNDVSRVAGEAVAMFIDGFRRDYDDRDNVFDPEKWRAEMEEKRRALRV